MFYLIENNDILNVCDRKTDLVILVLKYAKANEVTSIILTENLDHTTNCGKYLVQMDTEGFHFAVFDVVNTGYVRDYKEFNKLSDIYIREFKPADNITDVQRGEALKDELAMKNVRLFEYT